MVLNQNSKLFAERHAGLIAQEVLSAAQKSNSAMVDIVHKPETPEGLHSIRYELLVVPLVKTIQEQQHQLAGIQKLISELEQQLQILKNIP